MWFCLSGSQRVWVQFQWLFCLPEPQQDRRDPFPEQNFEPSQNQVRATVWSVWFYKTEPEEHLSSFKRRRNTGGTLTDHYIWNLSSKKMSLREMTSETYFFSFPFVGMATCCFSSLQDLLPLLGRWWTQPPHTHLHHYHLCHPLPRPPWSPGPCQHPRSRRMRSISIWPSKMARSTGTKIHSCKRRTCCLNPAFLRQILDASSLVADVAMAPWENVCTVYR